MQPLRKIPRILFTALVFQYSLSQDLVIALHETTEDSFVLVWEGLDTESEQKYQLQLQYIDAFDSQFSQGVNATVFNKSSILIHVTDTSYQLDKNYPEGILVARVRGLNPSTGWSNFIEIEILEDSNENLNWFQEITYTDSAKKINQITYYDGSLNERQNIKSLYSNQSTIINDFRINSMGQSVINMLPTPTKNRYVDFRPNFNRILNGIPLNIDTYDSGIVPELDSNYGTSKYFSGNNEIESIHRDYIPDAEGFPLRSTKYSNDYTAREVNSGNYGKALQTNDKGRFSQTYYGDASMEDLLPFFESNNLGNPEHYTTVSRKDANGNFTIEYLQEDKTIATALQGVNPPNLESLDSNSNTETFTYNLTDKNEFRQNSEEYVIIHEYTNLSPTPIEASFNYDITGVDFEYEATEITCNEEIEAAQTFCSNCVYELTFKIKDPNGNLVSLTQGNTSTIIQSQDECQNREFSRNYIFKAFLDQIGTYKIIKRLKLVSGNIDEQIEVPLLGISENLSLNLLDQLYSEADYVRCDTSDNSTYSEEEIREQLRAQCQNYAVLMASQMGIDLPPEELVYCELGYEQTLLDGNSVNVNQHEEYCHFCLCQELLESNVYDIMMMQTNSWQEAFDKGYLNPLAMNDSPAPPNLKDPFFELGPGNENGYRNQAIDNMLEFLESEFNIWEFIERIDREDEEVPDIDGKDAQWNLFKGLYARIKTDIIEQIKKDRGCNYSTNENALFQPPLPSDEDEVNEYADNLAEEYCDIHCLTKVEFWMSELANRCDVFDTNDNEIKTLLGAYCKNSCSIETTIPTIPCNGQFNSPELIQVAQLVQARYGCSLKEVCNDSVSFIEHEFCTTKKIPKGCLKEALEILKTYLNDREKIGQALEKSKCFKSYDLTGDDLYFVLYHEDKYNKKPCKIALTHISNETPLKIGNMGYAEFEVYNGKPSFLPAHPDLQLIGRINPKIKIYTSCALDDFKKSEDCTTVIAGLKPSDLMIDIQDEEPYNCSQCTDDINDGIETLVAQIVNEYSINTSSCFRNYVANECFNGAFSETLEMQITTYGAHHFTLFNYDLVGNLAKTTPPEGVYPINQNRDKSERKANLMATNYRHDSRNLILATRTPDADSTKTWYNSMNLVRFEQNANQKPNNEYKYIKYDDNNRAIETGIVMLDEDILVEEKVDIKNFPQNSLEKNEVVLTTWDVPDDDCQNIFNPVNLRGRISSIKSFDADADSERNCLSCYSYSALGHVDTYITQIRGLNPKRMDYEYELVSGLVDKLYYQKDSLDAFTTHYEYDLDNRLVRVQTQKGEGNWEQDATYQYYAHGPLARLELGGNLQGLDYTYTPQGWLKTINSVTLNSDRDPGEDGSSNSFSEDVFGFALRYFEDDYKRINNTLTNAPEPNYVGNDFDAITHNLYNGNIGYSINSSKVFMGNGGPLGFRYRYDQLNRLVSQTKLNALNHADTWTSNNAPSNGNYATTYSYDANGNITELTRNNADPVGMDRLTYRYFEDEDEKKTNNKLVHINDAIASTTYDNDLDDQGTWNSSNPNYENANYQYDAIGQLIADKSEDLQLQWYDRNNRLAKALKGASVTVDFTYDNNDQRAIKHVQPKEESDTLFYYVRDPKGKLIANYKAYVDQLELNYLPIYGLERLGIYNAKKNRKEYELKDHLGNVRSVITKNPSSDEVVVVSATDYYPFGSSVPDRTLSSDYTFGFNGKEKDNEIIAGEIYDFGSRIFTTNNTRWLSVDPRKELYPSFSPYSYSANNPINNIDIQGEFIATLSGTIIGGLTGGISSYLNGESVLSGIAEGAVSGAVAGGIVDLAIYSGGSSLVVMAAAGVGGGLGAASGHVSGEIVDGLQAGKDLNNAVKEISLEGMSEKVKSGAGWGVVGAAVPLDDIAKIGSKGVMNSMSESLETASGILMKQNTKTPIIQGVRKKITDGMSLLGKRTREAQIKIHASGTVAVDAGINSSKALKENK